MTTAAIASTAPNERPAAAIGPRTIADRSGAVASAVPAAMMLRSSPMVGGGAIGGGAVGGASGGWAGGGAIGGGGCGAATDFPLDGCLPWRRAAPHAPRRVRGAHRAAAVRVRRDRARLGRAGEVSGVGGASSHLASHSAAEHPFRATLGCTIDWPWPRRGCCRHAAPQPRMAAGRTNRLGAAHEDPRRHHLSPRHQPRDPARRPGNHRHAGELRPLRQMAAAAQPRRARPRGARVWELVRAEPRRQLHPCGVVEEPQGEVQLASRSPSWTTLWRSASSTASASSSSAGRGLARRTTLGSRRWTW